MLFILFAACVGHIGAMEPDKGIEQKKQGMQQGTKVPSLTQLAAIAKAKDLIQKIHSALSPQQAIDAYRTEKTSDFFTLPTDLQSPLLVELGRQYFILYDEALETGQEWGFSIQDYLTIPALKNKMPQITTTRGGIKLDLKNMKINNLKGLQNIPNIGTVQRLNLSDNKLATIPTNAFAGLTNLTSIVLDANQLTTIQPNAFAGLTNLKYLSLENNLLTTIQPNAFASLPNLETLDLDRNQLDKQTKEAIRKAIKALPQRVILLF